MNALYNQALRQFTSIQSDLSRLDGDPSASSAQYGPVTVSLTALTRTIDEYESLAKRELIQSKQQKALTRVAKFRDDYAELTSQLARLKAKRSATATTASPHRTTENGHSNLHSPSRDATQAYTSSSSYRSAGPATAESPFSLHARTSTTTFASGNSGVGPSSRSVAIDPSTDPLAAYRMNASAAAMFGGTAPPGTGAREGHALREHTFIAQTEAQLDAFLAQGREVLGSLVEQRGILKGTQRRLLDAANTMGLSRDVIGYIERRSTQDNILFAIGALTTLVCFYYIYMWFG